MHHRLPAILACVLAASPALGQTAEQLVGRWGLSAYWDAKDARAARSQARGACSAPYTIARAPSGNLMMHIADDPKPHEIRLVDGSMLVPVGEVPGGAARHSRALSGFDGASFELRWQDRGIASRYGVNVFVRCGR